ncbi:MAG: Regulatory protein RecX [Chlamydiae bacterium]|nr:Regulatory protein RecX [Chlamydiota bacterium]
MVKSAKNALIRLLARRDYFTFEVRSKLSEKGFPQDEIEKAISEMEKLGYLNDERRGRAYAKQQLALGYGPRAIEFKLRVKGGRSPYTPSREEQEEALRAYSSRKKLSFSGYTSKQKLFAKLSQRGFASEVISNYFSNSI